MTIIIFILILFVLVLVHELGHCIAAKKTGMRVDEFGIGFPPRIWGIRKGETLYSVNALPIGGFVRIYGEDMEDGEASASADRNRSFARKPKWAQSLVLVAGIGANILLAWLLFSSALAYGVLTEVEPGEASAAAELYVLEIIPGSPAETAGIPPGAVIKALSRGTETVRPRSPEEFRAFVSRSAKERVEVTYAMGSEEKTIALMPKNGVLAEAPETAAVGVSLGLAEVRALPVPAALLEGFKTTMFGLRDTVLGFVSLIMSAFTLQADLGSVRGPVGIAGLLGDARAFGLSALLSFTAIISLSLAVLNIVPFPALDGGRLLFVIIEAIKGSPIPAKVAYYTNTAGFAILVLLMIAITYHDITRLAGS